MLKTPKTTIKQTDKKNRITCFYSFTIKFITYYTWWSVILMYSITYQRLKNLIMNARVLIWLIDTLSHTLGHTSPLGFSEQTRKHLRPSIHESEIIIRWWYEQNELHIFNSIQDLWHVSDTNTYVRRPLKELYFLEYNMK